MIDDNGGAHEGMGCSATEKLRGELIRSRRSNAAFWDLAFNAMLAPAKPGSRPDDEPRCGLLSP